MSIFYDIKKSLIVNYVLSNAYLYIKTSDAFLGIFCESSQSFTEITSA